MRVINSIRNSVATLAQTLVIILFGFVVRALFIRTLGQDYVGLNGLFSSVLSMLSFAELGIGTAIVFNMYPAIASGDIETQKSLMRFYRNCYRTVAAAVTVIGLAILPFLGLLGSYHGINENIPLIYLLFLANSAGSYLFSYKRSLIYAYQKSYILSLFDSGTQIILNTAYIVLLLATHSFIFYLVATLVISVTENILLNAYTNRRYPWLKEKTVKKLDRHILAAFKKQVYGMIYHNVGALIVTASDNLVISLFLGLGILGMYSNYILITGNISGFILMILAGTIAGIGDLLTEKKPEKSFETYRNISFAAFWANCFAASATFVVMRPFVTIWIGQKSLLSTTVLLFIVLNFYVQGMRRPISIFQNAAGIYYENRHIPVIEAIINFIASIIFVKLFGLVGILLGTLLSTAVIYGYSFPKYIYAPLFHKSTRVYVWEQVHYLIVFLTVLALSTGASLSLAFVQGRWASLFVSLIIGLLVPNALLFLYFRKSKECQYFLGLIQKSLKRK